jgi:putative peptidoglycan lipid II flippase
MNSDVIAPTGASRAPKKRISLSGVAGLLVATSLIGQVLGILRTIIVNRSFNAVGPQSTDAYFAAFNIPDFFFFTVAAGALGVAFIPVLADRLHKGDKKGMYDLSSSLMCLLAIVMAVVGIIIFVFAEPLIKHVVAPKLSPEQLHNAVIIMRFVAFNPLLFTISGILASTQQTMGKFFFYAIAPLFYNVSIIISAYVFRSNIGLVGLGIGALIGGILQLIIVAVGMFGTGYRFHPKILWKNPDFRLILRQLPPRSLDQGIDQIESIVETNFARRLGEGYISYYNNAYTLSTAPEMLIGTAISTAAFPRLAARLSQGRPDLFRRDFLRILRIIIWLAAPVALICYFCRGYFARIIFANNQPQIALIFGFLTAAIFFRTIYTIISRWFYAQKDTKTPLFVSIFAILLNIILAYFLSRPTTYGAAGLAIAQSLVAAAEVAVLFTVMLIRDHRLFDANFWSGCAKIVSVTGFSLIAGFIMVSLFPLGISDKGILTLGTKVVWIAGVTFGVHIFVSWLLGLEEVQPVFSRTAKIMQRLLRPVRQPFDVR